jgi:glycerol dehydrogenase-like iron-containing ADH family enzyme
MSLRNVQYGRKMVEEIGASLPESFGVATMKDPWAVVSPRLKREAKCIAEVRDMGQEAVAELEQSIPSVKAVLGVGGGAVMDMAKYIHWKRDIPLYLMPTIASVDAAVTSSIAVREGGKVRYIGEAEPVVVGVDFPVVQSAPVHLNRAGVGDILSIHTALWDWSFSHQRGEDPYDEGIAAASAGMLERMMQRPNDLRDVTEDGIKLLFDLYNEVNDICERWGNSRPEEGSEHFFAYNVEYLTGQHFVHGELVCLGVYVLSHIQGNNPERVHEFINQVGVRYRLSELEISRDAFRETLLTLKDYAERESLFYSVINETEFDEGLVDDVLTRLDIE